jgi:hypothetical protein
MEYLKSYINEYIVKVKVHTSIGQLLSNDAFLLEHTDHEFSIAHRLALYLQQEFADWNVDCEYNRIGEQPKRINGNIIRPDIVVHHRGIKKDNLLAIETKKTTNSDSIQEDRLRLVEFGRTYGYKYTLFLLFKVGSEFGIDNETWNTI